MTSSIRLSHILLLEKNWETKTQAEKGCRESVAVVRRDRHLDSQRALAVGSQANHGCTPAAGLGNCLSEPVDVRIFNK